MSENEAIRVENLVKDYGAAFFALAIWRFRFE
jgi:hypothetical protein